MKNYVLVPGELETGLRIRAKFYQQMCILNLLQGKSALIPDVKFKKLSISNLKNGNYQIVPGGFSEDDFELISLYEKEEVNKFNQQVKDEKFSGSNENREMFLPVPVFEQEGLYRYKEICGKLSNNTYWLEQLIDFYIFLTGEFLEININRIKPTDFLYDQKGRIRYFLGFNYLKLKSDSEYLLNNNMNSLAHLLYNYYLEDTEKQEAKLYGQKWFEKIEGRLIEPLVIGDYSYKFYSNFEEIKLDLKGKLKDYLRKKRIGVFLDVANIFKVIGTIRIDFNKLFKEIYGRIESRKIQKKIAVIFIPRYESKQKSLNVFKKMIKIKKYLSSYGFQVIEVENDSARAKTIVNDIEIDVDDRKLIESMRKARDEVDSILLLTGDRHFYKIARDYQKNGKEVKIISLTKKSTYRNFISDFDHNFIYDYWQCIQWGPS